MVDLETKRPIYGAVVRIEYSGETYYGSTTKSDGTFSVATIAGKGEGQLIISLVSYHDFLQIFLHSKMMALFFVELRVIR